MVVLKGKAQTQSSSPLSLAPKSEATLQKEALSFSQLLQGFAIVGKGTKPAQTQQTPQTQQNPQTQLTPAEVAKKLTSKLQTSQLTLQNAKSQTPQTQVPQTKEKEPQTSQTQQTQSTKAPIKSLADLLAFSSEKELTAAMGEKMPQAEIKLLINEAKEYLKSKIKELPEYKTAEITSLPNTLKGLTQLAQKLGVDLSKITLEEVRKGLPQKSQELQLAQSSTDSSSEVKEQKTAQKPQNTALENGQKVQNTQQTQLVQTQQTQELKQSQTEQKEREFVAKAQEQKTEPKEAPLAKAQTQTQMSTHEITVAKSATVEMQKPKERSDENLKLLLRTQSTQKSDPSLTSDVAVASAKLIAPSATSSQTQVQNSQPQNATLESLLQGARADESSVTMKQEMQTLPKAESFEVKINEAKQMMRYLSQDVKSAIEDYKSPFTRIKVQLNPQRLGEIDLTVVQRANNLHVTLTSNNTAINTLSVHATELRQQLANSGINNATLNFSNTSQNGDGAAFGQQNSQHSKEEARRGYRAFEQDELREEIVSSLEIVVPNYA